VIRLVLLLLVLAAGGVYLVRMVEKRRRERLAQVRAAFLVSVRAPRDRGPAYKDAALRSGAVRMRLPRHWAEEYPDEDHASFRDPGSPQRVLRVACTAVAAAPAGLRALLQARAGREATTIEDLPEGRVLLRSLDASREDGRDVVVFRWLSATLLPPSEARLAAFALSVPEQTALDPLTQDVVAMLDLEIRSARLA
jgi:hypothetical protein